MNNKLFLLLYYWPPAGGPGVQRWLGFTRYLVEFGWDITVVVPANAAYPLEDFSLNADIHPDLRIVRVPILEPGQLGRWLFPVTNRRISSGIISEHDPSLTERVLLRIRANVFVPDARVAWIQPAVRSLKKLMSSEERPILITSGPPHSLHLAGMRLKEMLPEIRWFADFRDPWTGISYHRRLPLGPRAKRRHIELERQVLHKADRILVTSEATRREFERLARNPIGVFTNGYDINTQGFHPRPEFSWVHVGSLLTERNPGFLWEVLGNLSETHEIIRRELRLDFWGAVSEEVLSRVRAHGLGFALNQRGYAAHKDVPEILGTAQILLLIEADHPGKKEIIPGKLFEYLSSGRPVVAIGPDQWEAGRIVEETDSGYYLRYGESERLKQTIVELFRIYEEHKGRIPRSHRDVSTFSRKAISRRLSNYLNGTGI